MTDDPQRLRARLGRIHGAQRLNDQAEHDREHQRWTDRPEQLEPAIAVYLRRLSGIAGLGPKADKRYPQPGDHQGHEQPRDDQFQYEQVTDAQSLRRDRVKALHVQSASINASLDELRRIRMYTHALSVILNLP